ncbi:unnamed protein product [Closterium sp. NIES-65]|nr:unnamed protein product [Closterium sp. NIES-65]
MLLWPDMAHIVLSRLTLVACWNARGAPAGELAPACTADCNQPSCTDCPPAMRLLLLPLGGLLLAFRREEPRLAHTAALTAVLTAALTGAMEHSSGGSTGTTGLEACGLDRCVFLAVHGREDGSQSSIQGRATRVGERWRGAELQGAEEEAAGDVEEEVGQGRRNTVEVVAALSLLSSLCSGVSGGSLLPPCAAVSALAWAGIPRVAAASAASAAASRPAGPAHSAAARALARPAPRCRQAWTRAQRQLAGQQAEQQAEQQGMQEGRGGGKKQHQGQAAAVVGVQIAVAGRPSLSGGCAGADLVLLSAVCAPLLRPPPHAPFQPSLASLQVVTGPASVATHVAMLPFQCRAFRGLTYTRPAWHAWDAPEASWLAHVRACCSMPVLLPILPSSALLCRSCHASFIPFPHHRIRAALSTPARVLIILGHEGTLSSDSATWRRVIGHTKAHSRFFDAERLGEALRRAVRARRAAVDEMAQMLGEATEFASGGAVGSVSGGSMQWHDLLWTGLFSPSFGEALERHESAEVLLLLCRILQGRQGRRGENGGKALHRWLEGGGRGRGEGGRMSCHGSLVVRLWALVPESQCRPWLHRISAHLTCYSPAYLHYCALHQYTCSSSPRLRVPAAVQQPGIHWWRPPSEAPTEGAGDAGDAATPPKFIALQPAMALALLAQGSGALSGALSHVPFEVNAEERAAVTCPSSLVLHGRSAPTYPSLTLSPHPHSQARTRQQSYSTEFCTWTVSLSRLDINSPHSPLPPRHRQDNSHTPPRAAPGTGSSASLPLPPHLLLGLPSPANASITAQGDGVGDDVGDGSGGGLRQVVLTRSLHLCASIQTELVKAARSRVGAAAAACACSQEDTMGVIKAIAALDAFQAGSPRHSPKRVNMRTEHRQLLQQPVNAWGAGAARASNSGSGSSSGGRLLMREDLESALMGGLPLCIAAIPPTAFPLALTLSKLLRLLDASVSRPFLHSTRRRRRQEEARQRLVLAIGVSGRGVRKGAVQGGNGGEKGRAWEEASAAGVEEGGMAGEDGGSSGRLQSLQGHVGEEEYVGGMVGSNERTSGMRGADRQAVYDVFRAYERRKRRQGEYDCADLVGYLHREVRRMRASNEPWWAVEDGVAVGGASSSGASRDGASRSHHCWMHHHWQCAVTAVTCTTAQRTEYGGGVQAGAGGSFLLVETPSSLRAGLSAPLRTYYFSTSSPHRTPRHPWHLVYTYMRQHWPPHRALAPACLVAAAPRAIAAAVSATLDDLSVGQKISKHWAAEYKTSQPACEPKAYARVCIALVAVLRVKAAVRGNNEGQAEAVGAGGEGGRRAYAHGNLWAAMGIVAVKEEREVCPEYVKRVSSEKDWKALGFTVSWLGNNSLCSAGDGGRLFFQRGDYEAARASFERAGDTGNARFAEATMFYEAGIGCTAQPSAAAIAVSTSSASSASSALPPVLPDLSLLSCTDLLLAAARCFEGIKRGLEAGPRLGERGSYGEMMAYVHLLPGLPAKPRVPGGREAPEGAGRSRGAGGRGEAGAGYTAESGDAAGGMHSLVEQGLARAGLVAFVRHLQWRCGERGGRRGSGMEQRDSRGGEQKGRVEWKGAEQLRAELMLAYTGLQESLSMTWGWRGRWGRRLRGCPPQGGAGKMEGKQAVKAVKGVWEKEFEKRLEDTRRVVFDGVQLCSSALISCSDKVTMATCKHHMATASEPPLSLHQTPFPCPSLLSPVHTLFFLSEPFLSLLPVTTLSCSRSAFFQPCSLTPTHNLLTSLLLHPSPSSTHSRLHARLHLTLLHLKAALAALLLLPDNRLEKRKSREKQAASAEEGSGGAGGVGGSGSRGGCGGSCGEGEGKAGVGCENGVGVAWTAHGAAVGNTAGQRVVGAVLHGACMEETAGLSEKEAWGITQLLLVSTVNSFPDPRNPPYFKQQFGSLKGNPLMATSVNGFFESLSTRALLYQQASNMEGEFIGRARLELVRAGRGNGH